MIITAVCKKGYLSPTLIQNFVLVNAIQDFVNDHPALEHLLTTKITTLEPKQWTRGQAEYDILAWTSDRSIDYTMVIWVTPNVHDFDRPTKKQSAKTRREGKDAREYMTVMGEALGATEVRPKFVAIRLPNGERIGFMVTVFERHLRHTDLEVTDVKTTFKPEPVTAPRVEVLAATTPVPQSRDIEGL